MTFIKSKLAPEVLEQLQNVESQADHSFHKMYQVSKHPVKAQRRFFEPKMRKKSDYERLAIEYSTKYLEQVGVKPKPVEEVKKVSVKQVEKEE